jgi:hypothetical protein
MKLRFLGLAAALSIGTAAHAWNATGHMVIAAIARANLSPSARAEAERLLKIDADRAGADDFVTVGSWADDVRNERRETGGWHFKDIFFRDDNKPAANQAEEPNAVTKIREFAAVLSDKSKSDSQRAEALRFVIHLVGDIHQPLHATSRETEAHPKGDRGGNDFTIVPPAESGERGPKNLHSLWDGGAGLFPFVPREQTRSVATAEARVLMATLPRSAFRAVTESDPDKWALESFKDARSTVYSLKEGTEPSADYLQKAQALVARRATLAGYRLADLLNKALP